MSCDDEIKALMVDIRDNQRRSLEHQEEHLSITREQMERANRQVTESLVMQKAAIDRAKQLTRIVIPVIALCIGMIVYLIVNYL